MGKDKKMKLTVNSYFSEQNIANIAFWGIGLLAGLFVFRLLFPVFALLYNGAVFYLALRSLFLLFRPNISKTPWAFQIKFFSLAISLVFSLLFGLEFFYRNFAALASQFLMILIFLKNPTDGEAVSYINGFKISLMINYLFGLVQLLFILIKGINIFYPVGLYLGLYESVSASQEASTRVTGLVWDPYVIGMYCTLGFFLFKTRIIKILTIVLLYFSFSRAGEVGFICAALYYFFPVVKKWMRKEHLAMPLFCLCFFVFLAFVPIFIDVLDFDRGFSRKSQGWRRVEYITKIPEIWNADGNPFLAIFGGAPAYTGARHVLTSVDSKAKRDILRLKKEKRIYWTVETDWFGILIGRGIFGFLAYLSLYLYIVFSNCNRKNKAIAISVLMAGVGYYYDTAIFSMFTIYFAGATKDINRYLSRKTI